MRRSATRDEHGKGTGITSGTSFISAMTLVGGRVSQRGKNDQQVPSEQSEEGRSDPTPCRKHLCAKNLHKTNLNEPRSCSLAARYLQLQCVHRRKG